jgi:hypothetical protein
LQFHAKGVSMRCHEKVLAMVLCLFAASWAFSVKDSTVYGRTCHLVTWKDNRGKERKAALVYVGDHTGICQYLTYYDKNTLVVSNTGSPDSDPLNSGFGSSCHHGATHYVQGTLTQRFVGASMAIFDWVHDINGATETITYIFMEGHDYFQWVETINALTGTAAGDSRGPYCTMSWDGIGGPTEGLEYGAARYLKQPVITGSGWPTRSGPFTMSGTCDIPYAWEWAHAREIGYVATQTFTQQHQGTPNWSANIAASGTLIDCDGTRTPATNKDDAGITDYQMNFYDQWMKITWGQPYGWTNNTPDGNAGNCLKNGWGQYSLAIILDSKADSGVMRVRDENRAIHNGSVAFTATLGTVKTQGQVGMANPTHTQNLSPVGYDHNYRAWAITAAANNQATMNLNITGTARLVCPTFCVSGMTALPTGISLNGIALASGTGYFASFDATNSNVWITLFDTLSGVNALGVNTTTRAARPLLQPAQQALLTWARIGNSQNLRFSFNATVAGNAELAVFDMAGHQIGSARCGLTSPGAASIIWSPEHGVPVSHCMARLTVNGTLAAVRNLVLSR